MVRPRFLATSALVVALLTAGVAHALTEAEVLQEAQALLADYQDLEAHVLADDLPHAQMLATYQSLETQRDAVEADRVSLGPSCGCAEVDDALADIAAVSADIAVAVMTWDEQ